MSRTAADTRKLPKIEISWTTRELASFAKLISRRPAKPTPALIQMMKEGA